MARQAAIRRSESLSAQWVRSQRPIVLLVLTVRRRAVAARGLGRGGLKRRQRRNVRLVGQCHGTAGETLGEALGRIVRKDAAVCALGRAGTKALLTLGVAWMALAAFVGIHARGTGPHAVDAR